MGNKQSPNDKKKYTILFKKKWTNIIQQIHKVIFEYDAIRGYSVHFDAVAIVIHYRFEVNELCCFASPCGSSIHFPLQLARYCMCTLYILFLPFKCISMLANASYERMFSQARGPTVFKVFVCMCVFVLCDSFLVVSPRPGFPFPLPPTHSHPTSSRQSDQTGYVHVRNTYS